MCACSAEFLCWCVDVFIAHYFTPAHRLTSVLRRGSHQWVVDSGDRYERL